MIRRTDKGGKGVKNLITDFNPEYPDRRKTSANYRQVRCRQVGKGVQNLKESFNPGYHHRSSIR